MGFMELTFPFHKGLRLVLKYSSGPAELDGQGAQLQTHFLTNWQLRPAFRRKKNFENLSKIERVGGKNVNCAPIFKQLPPALQFNSEPRVSNLRL